MSLLYLFVIVPLFTEIYLRYISSCRSVAIVFGPGGEFEITEDNDPTLCAMGVIGETIGLEDENDHRRNVRLPFLTEELKVFGLGDKSKNFLVH